jgi:hypothetical protein
MNRCSHTLDRSCLFSQGVIFREDVVGSEQLFATIRAGQSNAARGIRGVAESGYEPLNLPSPSPSTGEEESNSLLSPWERGWG